MVGCAPRAQLPSDERAPELNVALSTDDRVADVLRSLPPSIMEDSRGGELKLFEVELNGAVYTLLKRPIKSAGTVVSLSPREREIVRLVARGLPNKAVAAVLEVSLWTVSSHLRRVFSKLHVSSRAEMIARVLEEGLLSSHELTRATGSSDP